MVITVQLELELEARVSIKLRLLEIRFAVKHVLRSSKCSWSS